MSGWAQQGKAKQRSGWRSEAESGEWLHHATVNHRLEPKLELAVLLSHSAWENRAALAAAGPQRCSSSCVCVLWRSKVDPIFAEEEESKGLALSPFSMVECAKHLRPLLFHVGLSLGLLGTW